MANHAKAGRKATPNSVRGLIEQERAPDLTAATAPRDVFGVEALSEYGLLVYDQLFRSRAEWSIADLSLIAQAAQVSQRIDELNKSVVPGCLLLTNEKTGAVKLHPALNSLNDQRRLYATLIRDAGVRARDGLSRDNASSKPVEYTPAPQPTSEPPSGGFDAWLEEQTLQ